jgi:hypothetical protein
MASRLFLCWLCVIALEGNAFALQDEDEKCQTVSIIDEYQLDSYQRDGFIVMSGLLSDELVDRLSEAGLALALHGQKFPEFFSVMERGVIFDGAISGTSSEKDAALDFSIANTFREAALYSKIPHVAAELMQLDPDQQNLRVLR